MPKQDALRRAGNAVERMLLRIEMARTLIAADVRMNHGDAAGALVQERIDELLVDLRAERKIHADAIAAAGA